MDPKMGGPCQGIRNSIPELEKLGVHNQVVCLDKPAAGFLGNDNFPVHAIGPSKSPWNFSANLIPWLKSHMNDFDVWIIHGLWLYHSYAAIKAISSLAKRKKFPKVFVMPHGMLDPYFQKAAQRKWKALRNDVYWSFLEKKVINKADGLLFTCEEELLLARTTFPNYRPKKELNVGYGIQPPPFRTQAMQEALKATIPMWSGRPYILYLSRIHSKKGVDHLIEAYLTLEKESQHLPQLIIAGPNEHEYGKEMQAFANTSKNILFTGMLKGDAKWGAFYGCEAFVLPSHQENFGIAVAEALACKKPVLISNKVNIWREIETGGGGFIEEDTEIGAYQLLKRWVHLPLVDRNLMSQKAYEVYHDHFTTSSACRKLVDALNTMTA